MQPSKAAGIVVALLILASEPALAQSNGETKTRKWPVGEICDLIDKTATQTGIPRTYFTRLLWTESRFDIYARSPVGAQGIAQFMPATAAERGLKNPFDPAQAIPASADLLNYLRDEFGNYGLAAAAYNAGPGRVRRWLTGRSGLPFETQNYVAAITGQLAPTFKNPKARVNAPKLHAIKPFAAACRALPVMRTRFKGPTPLGKRAPWGVQVSANFSQNRAMRSWLRVRPKLGLVIGASEPALYRVRTPRGMKSKWAVRLGTPDRKSAITLCKKIRRVGGFCLVRKN